MTSISCKLNKFSDIERSIESVSTGKDYLSPVFEDVEVNNERATPLVEGEKKTRYDFTEPERQLFPEAVSGNYGVVAGGRLLIFDVDLYGEEEISNEMLEFLYNHFTFTVKTPHGGFHFYYLVPEGTAERIKEELGSYNPEPGGVEVNSRNSYTVGPGSELDGCSKDWCDDCSETGKGQYQIDWKLPLEELPVDEFIEVAKRVQQSNSGKYAIESVSEADIHSGEVDEGVVSEVETAVSQYYSDEKTTQRAKEWLHDMMRGNYETLGFDSEDHARSEAEVAFFSQLYGMLRKYTDMSMNEAVESASTYLTHCCNEWLWTDGGDPRKWGHRGENYRSNVANTVIGKFDPGVWKRAQKKRKEWVKDDDYSSLTYHYVLEAVEELAQPDFGEYPTRKEVVARAQEEDPSRDEESHRKALSRLQKEQGEIKMAYLGGNDYIYLPAEMPDPPEAEWIKIEGEKQEAEEPETETTLPLDAKPMSNDNQPAFLRFSGRSSTTSVGDAVRSSIASNTRDLLEGNT